MLEYDSNQSEDENMGRLADHFDHRSRLEPENQSHKRKAHAAREYGLLVHDHADPASCDPGLRPWIRKMAPLGRVISPDDYDRAQEGYEEPSTITVERSRYGHGDMMKR